MTLDTFFEKFDQFADAPNAVAKMRELVLQLAVRGQLLDRDRGIVNWPRIALRDVCSQITDGEHATPQRTANGVPLATAKNVRDGYLDLTNTDWVAPSTAEKCWKRCKPRHDDILMVCVGATTGRVCLVQQPPDIVLVRSVALIRPHPRILLPSFLNLFLRSPIGQAQIWGNVKQSAQPCLYLGKIGDFSISIPSTAEQKRIVAKVDELMALCDQLSAQQEQRETQHAALSRASLSRFADAPTPANLNFLFHKSFTIPAADLRKTILTLAVQGKLVTQDPSEQPAEILYCELHTQRSKLSNNTDDAQTIELPFKIPKSWKTVNLDAVTQIISGNAFKSGEFNNKGGVKVIKIKNVGVREFHETDEFLPDGFNNTYNNFMVRAGDILVALTRPYILNGLKVTRCPESYDRSLLNQRVGAIQTFKNNNIFEFVYLYLCSAYALEYVIERSRTLNQPNLNIPDLRRLGFPLPPLAEQRRIVAKVDQLMALVDKLETQLATARATAENLVETIVAELTNQD